MSTSTGVQFLDVLDPGFDFGSTEVRLAQDRNWYADSPIGIIVLRYAEAQELLRDQRLNHNSERYLEMNGVVDGPIYDWFVPMIVSHDGEHHRRLRGLVNKAFTPRMISNLRPFIRAQAEQLADRLESADEIDFVRDFADKLPLAVMCELLGVPAEDYADFRVWTSDIGLVFGIALGEDIRQRVEAAVVGLNGYVDSLLEAKRADPGDDLISALLAIQRTDESRVSLAELQNLIVTLVFAAHDTTRHQLANAMATFAEYPEQWAALGRQPELADQAVEEVMRWNPSSTTLYRFAAEDFDYRDLHLTTGTFLSIGVAIAQRDSRVFHNGHTFDITVQREAPPLQFGGGPHHCLGSALARAELSEALPVLAPRLGPPTITGPVTWRPAIGIRGPYQLPLRFATPRQH
ncbi:MAG TPA: cytochrome P450 [Pseudonocardiaceae bacterium]|nr:cytochrome P450 [Pseudonocardiaceae bacterium]